MFTQLDQVVPSLIVFPKVLFPLGSNWPKVNQLLSSRHITWVPILQKRKLIVQRVKTKKKKSLMGTSESSFKRLYHKRFKKEGSEERKQGVKTIHWRILSVKSNSINGHVDGTFGSTPKKKKTLLWEKERLARQRRWRKFISDGTVLSKVAYHIICGRPHDPVESVQAFETDIHNHPLTVWSALKDWSNN